MPDHILIRQATRTPYSGVPTMPDDVEYDAARGYWTRGGAPLVRMQGAWPASKKADMETGEDLKGE